MNLSILMRVLALIALFFALANPVRSAESDPKQAGELVSSAQFTTDAMQFVEREIAAHLIAIEQLDPPQDYVLGVPTAGDFTWGSLMRATAMTATLTGKTHIGGRDISPLLGKIGLIDARQGARTFSQLGAALTLLQFGADLKSNALWQSLTPAEQAEWRDLLDPGRFYDREKREVINLPENYFGVAARIAAIGWKLGIITDRAYADDLLERAARQFLEGALYADDHLPTGRFDRYSQEYVRFVYDAALTLGRDDVAGALEPAINAVVGTWWAIVSPDGYGYPWGRSVGPISYMDTLEIVAFLGRYPKFRPAPLPVLAGLYYRAWEWLQHDYDPDRHLLDIFRFGRGNYSYINPQRHWQQTTSFLYKAADSLRMFADALDAESVASFPGTPRLPDVTRFDWFRKGDRPAGVWAVRLGRFQFALPITTGVKPGVADYLPAPHGLPGSAAPVQQCVPALVPYIELEDGRTFVAGDCADEIHPSNDGKSLRAIWNRWVVVREGANDESQQFVDPGLTTEVTWTVQGEALTRNEKITASRAMTIRRFRVLFPSTAPEVFTRFEDGRRIDRFDSPDTSLEVSVTRGSIPLKTSLRAPGDSALGRGARGPIPLVLEYQATNLSARPDAPLDWTLSLRLLQ
jgi:hypothetical protein